MPISYRQMNFLLLLIPASLLAYGYYLQYVDGLEPCALCMTQRIGFYLVAITALIAIFNQHSNITKNILSTCGGLFCIVGMAVAGRQLWLQSLPEDQIPACGPDFNYIMETFPILEAVEIMFKGNGNCAEVVWQFLGLSIAGWAFIAFFVLLIMNAIQLFRKL